MLSASRAQVVHAVVRPALERGEIVLVDRYADSTVAYQAFGAGIPLHDIEELTRIATGGLQPHLTVFLDVSPEEGLRRLQGRGAPNRLDAESLDFHRKVQVGYEYLIARQPERWVRIDGSKPPDAVHLAIVRAVRLRVPAAGERT